MQSPACAEFKSFLKASNISFGVKYIAKGGTEREGGKERERERKRKRATEKMRERERERETDRQTGKERERTDKEWRPYNLVKATPNQFRECR